MKQGTLFCPCPDWLSSGIGFSSGLIQHRQASVSIWLASASYTSVGISLAEFFLALGPLQSCWGHWWGSMEQPPKGIGLSGGNAGPPAPSPQKLGLSCLDPKRKEVVEQLQLSLTVLAGTIERAMGAAEKLGAVHQVGP